MKRTTHIIIIALLLVATAGKAEDSLYAYRGIAYAHSGRYEMPIISDGPDANADYSQRGPKCPQTGLGEKADGMRVSEECQVVSVFSPVPMDDARPDTIPVVVYIHGGSFHSCTGEREDSQLPDFTKQTGIISVSISYRLGAFGYLYAPDSIPTNLGHKDMMTAMEWIRQNIHRFGGDTNRITLCGQSAGAEAIAFMMADTTFKPAERVVLFSAPLGITQSKHNAKRFTDELIRNLHGQNVRTCPADSIVEAFRKLSEDHRFIAMPFMPTEVEFSPKDTKGIHWPEQVVVCTQAEDGSMFSKTFEPLITKEIFRKPAKRFTSYLQKQGVNAIFHEFTWRPRGSKRKASHCCELPLLFGYTKTWIGASYMGEVTAEELQPMRDETMKRFAKFIRTGEWTLE